MCWGGHCKAVSPQARDRQGARFLAFQAPKQQSPWDPSSPQCLPTPAPCGNPSLALTADPLHPTPTEHQVLTTHSASGSPSFSQHPLF